MNFDAAILEVAYLSDFDILLKEFVEMVHVHVS